MEYKIEERSVRMRDNYNKTGLSLYFYKENDMCEEVGTNVFLITKKSLSREKEFNKIKTKLIKLHTARYSDIKFKEIGMLGNLKSDIAINPDDIYLQDYTFDDENVRTFKHNVIDRYVAKFLEIPIMEGEKYFLTIITVDGYHQMYNTPTVLLKRSKDYIERSEVGDAEGIRVEI